MHQGITDSRHRVIQCRKRGVLYIRRHIPDDEETHQRMSQLRLTRTFRAKEIEDREGASLSRHDVTEERSHQETEPYASVIPEHAEYLPCKVNKRQRGIPQVYERLLKLIEFVVLLVLL